MQFNSMGDEEIADLMLPCESGGGFKVGILKIDVLVCSIRSYLVQLQLQNKLQNLVIDRHRDKMADLHSSRRMFSAVLPVC
jgi:hypothetical protein